MFTSSLEAMNELDLEGQEPKEVSLEAEMFDMWEAELEITEAQAVVDEYEGIVADAEDNIADLEHLAMCVEKYGISAPMMMAADRKGLLEAEGIVSAYEEMEVTPVKDAVATAAVEGFVDTVKSIWKKLIAFFAKIGRAIGDLFRKIMRGFKTYENAIVAMVKKLGDADIDEAKLKDVKMKAIKYSDMSDMSALTGDIAEVAVSGVLLGLAKQVGDLVGQTDIKEADLKKLEGEIFDAVKGLADEKYKKKCGLEVKVKDGKVTSCARVKATDLKATSDNMKSLGYDKADKIVKELKSTHKAIVTLTKAEKQITAIDKQYEYSSKILATASKQIDGLSPEQQKAKQKAASLLKDVNSYAKTCNSVALANVRTGATILMTVAKKMLGKKKK